MYIVRHILALSLIATSSVALLGNSETDRKIEDAAKASYNYRTLLDKQVTVKANEGVVTLTGMVADKELQSIAKDTVSNLPGVTRVDNQITLDPAMVEYSDAWMAWKIRYQLLARANVSYLDTKVGVTEGVATLTGTAANAAEKDLAGVYAEEIEGVKSVNNQITIVAEPQDPKKVAQSIDDASISSRVRNLLASDKSTSGIKTTVATADGVVTLTGVAGSKDEKTLVGTVTKSIRGVKSVTNDMTVKT